MSSCYVFSVLGFFPNAGVDIYSLNVPLFPHADVLLREGKTMKIITENSG